MKLTSLPPTASAALSSCATVFPGTSPDGPCAGQVVRLFPSMASKVDGDNWHLHIHGRIYEPAEGSQFRQGLVNALALLVPPGAEPQIFRRRAGLLPSDIQGNAVVIIAIGKESVRLPSTNATRV